LDFHYGSIMGYARDDTTFSVDWHIVEQIWPLPMASVPVSVTVSQIWPLPAVNAPASVTMPTVTEVRTESKLSRNNWLERQYPPDQDQTNLAMRYATITKASKAIHKEMQDDPGVEPYKSPRPIESYLADLNLWPKRRKQR
jgi:hypothetical protein